MKLKNLYELAVNSLKAHKLRTILTVLGISIGISVVILIMSAGRGLDKMITSELDIYSPNMIEVEVKVPNVKKTSSENAIGLSTGISITTLKNKDMDLMLSHPNISAAYGWLVGQEVVSYQGENRRVLVMGQGYNKPNVEKFDLAEGRFFTEDEENSLRQVVVLGPTVKNDLFGQNEAIGKNVYIRGKPFKVIGVSKERGSAFFIDMDDLVIIPSKTMQKRLLGIDYLSAIMAKMIDLDKADQTQQELTEMIREQHNISDPDKDDFSVNTMQEAMDMLGTIVDGIVILLVALVFISLIVGGVGIMNIMYVSVTERTFEIGLRKSLGARKQDILRQFLLEAVLLTMAGGVVGVVLGAILSLVVYLVALRYGFNWVYSIPLSSVLLSVGFSGFVGLLFGYYPAKKAADLNPIEALRKE